MHCPLLTLVVRVHGYKSCASPGRVLHIIAGASETTHCCLIRHLMPAGACANLKWLDKCHQTCIDSAPTLREQVNVGTIHPEVNEGE